MVGRQRRRRPTEETRAAVLDAAQNCFTRYGVEQTTIDDIVRAAGVPRATLYRHAGSRDDLLLAVTLREIDRLIDELARHVAGHDHIDDVIVDGVVQTIELIRSSPLLSALAANPGAAVDGSISEHVTTALMERLEHFVEPIFEPARRAGLLRPELPLADAVEILVRTIQSHLVGAHPRRRSDSQLKDFLRRSLVPVLVPDSARAAVATAPLSDLSLIPRSS